MRPFEIALSIANLWFVVTLFIPKRRLKSWMRLSAPLGALVAAAHLTIEGARWQMAPAYMLAAAFLAAWLVGLALPAAGARRRILSFVASGVGLLVFALSAALPIVLPVFRLPAPSGRYGIGTATYLWEDAARPELFSLDPNDRRELPVQIWYPARTDSSARRAPYIEHADAMTPGLAKLFHLPSFFFSYFRYVTTDAVEDAPVSSAKASYPVLIYLTGLGGFPSTSMFQVQRLVSDGYIVAALDQPGGAGVVSLPDRRTITMLPRAKIQALIDQSIAPAPEAPELLGRPMPEGILPYFARDVSFAIDQLARIDRGDSGDRLSGRMDLGEIGVFGVSLGAMVAAQSAYMDGRIKAVLMMDAAMPSDVVRSGLRKPSMWMTRPAATMRLERSRSGGWTEKDIAETLTTMRKVFDESAPGSAYYLQMPGMFHVNFTDAPAWSPFTTQLGLTGPVDGKKMFGIVDAYSAAFFDRYLKGSDEPLLDAPKSPYREVIFERR